MLSFESPLVLLLFVLLLPLVFLRHFWRGRGSSVPYSISLWPREDMRNRFSLHALINFFAHLAFWGSISCCIVALANPVYVIKKKIYLTRGIDIFIVLDESPSMAAKDFQPKNRFEAAKRVVHEFVSSRVNDPVGLVTFGKEAVLRVPPTLDYGIVQKSLRDMQIMSMGNGTAIGMGLSIAIYHLKDSTAVRKIIILLTDGDNNCGEIQPISAAEMGAKMGIKIYSVGIGSKGEVALEFEDPESGKIYRGLLDSGFNEDLLKRIAFISGGRYFSATTAGALDAIFKSIDSSESIEKRIRIDTEKTSYYQDMIFWAMVLFLVDIFLRKIILREIIV